MIHLVGNRTANEANLVAMLPERDERGKEVAKLYFADGSQVRTRVLALTIRRRLAGGNQPAVQAERLP